jgi:hypothetical protein
MSPMIAKHETFHPRYGWLKKGFEKSSNHPRLFNSEKALVELGVGKNMVRAIKYWCLSFKIIEEVLGQKNMYWPTEFGKKLLGEAGWDEFLENPSSLWLLHWYLLKPPCYATAWYYTFNYFNQMTFTANDLLLGLKTYVSKAFTQKRICVESSLKKDINCIIRMYVSKSDAEDLKEDSIDCPFTDLRLIREDGNRRFSFNIGKKPTLSAEIIVSACLDFCAGENFDSGAKTTSISRLLYEPGSPGQAFKIDEGTLCDAIESVAKRSAHIFISDTAGVVQFGYKKNPIELAEKTLALAYELR